MIELPKRDGSTYAIDATMLAALQRDYPRIDVDTELRKMRNWLEANPRNRKTDVHRFIVNWLNRARPQAAGGVSRETSLHPVLYSERLAQQIPTPPPRYAPHEVSRQHLDSVYKMLGVRR
jgi:hypothetical protein